MRTALGVIAGAMLAAAIVMYLAWYTQRSDELRREGCTARVVGKVPIWTCPTPSPVVSALVATAFDLERAA